MLGHLKTKKVVNRCESLRALRRDTDSSTSRQLFIIIENIRAEPPHRSDAIRSMAMNECRCRKVCTLELLGDLLQVRADRVDGFLVIGGIRAQFDRAAIGEQAK